MSDIMSLFLDRFPDISREEWETKYREEYEQILKKEYNPDEFILSPLQDNYDSPADCAPLKKRTEGFAASVPIYMDSDLSDSYVEECLQYGPSMIHVIGENITEKLLNTALNNVLVDHVSIWFSPSTEESLRACLKYASRNSEGSFYVDARWSHLTQENATVKYVETISLDSTVNSWLADFERWHEKGVSGRDVLFRFEMDNQILRNIAFVRAFKIAFADRHDGEVPLLIGTAPLLRTAVDKADQLLSNSIKALSMAYAGMDFIEGSHFQKANEKGQLLYNCRIPQLLTIETDFYKSSDPAAGSYYIENLTLQFLQS